MHAHVSVIRVWLPYRGVHGNEFGGFRCLRYLSRASTSLPLPLLAPAPARHSQLRKQGAEQRN